uniref:PB1 domain-containing protein n=1 Tax=Setaria viridis TaxID=4556 RepID=A0A4U6W6P8_SETVI|nr:hypothetical protein SEVIR_1G106600v2 [Setaria viridis]
MAGSKERPGWLPEEMDPKMSYNLEIHLIANNTRSRRYNCNKVVDADITNFKDLLKEIEDKYLGGYDDVVKFFYYCSDTKSNIEVNSNQELVEMFAKHVSTKTCYISIAHYHPSCEAPAIPLWHECVQVPCTPSMLDPKHLEPSQFTQTQDNPELENEHVGIDEEGMYIDIGPQIDPAAGNEEDVVLSNFEVDSDSDSNYEDDVDEVVKDKEPPINPEVVYDKADPPMEERV